MFWLTDLNYARYLDSAVKFAYTMYQTLEKYAESRDEIHFRKRRAAQLIKCTSTCFGFKKLR